MFSGFSGSVVKERISCSPAEQNDRFLILQSVRELRCSVIANLAAAKNYCIAYIGLSEAVDARNNFFIGDRR